MDRQGRCSNRAAKLCGVGQSEHQLFDSSSQNLLHTRYLDPRSEFHPLHWPRDFAKARLQFAQRDCIRQRSCPEPDCRVACVQHPRTHAHASDYGYAGCVKRRHHGVGDHSSGTRRKRILHGRWKRPRLPRLHGIRETIRHQHLGDNRGESEGLAVRLHASAGGVRVLVLAGVKRDLHRLESGGLSRHPARSRRLFRGDDGAHHHVEHDFWRSDPLYRRRHRSDCRLAAVSGRRAHAGPRRLRAEPLHRQGRRRRRVGHGQRRRLVGALRRRAAGADYPFSARPVCRSGGRHRAEQPLRRCHLLHPRRHHPDPAVQPVHRPGARDHQVGRRQGRRQPGQQGRRGGSRRRALRHPRRRPDTGYVSGSVHQLGDGVPAELGYAADHLLHDRRVVARVRRPRVQPGGRHHRVGDQRDAQGLQQGRRPGAQRRAVGADTRAGVSAADPAQRRRLRQPGRAAPTPSHSRSGRCRLRRR